ncbi:MAG: PglZ domain-containing protein [Muribaculaceae bacterium]|nr:PglZ domain-containing protein [Muribaculaceae bacterium]
MMDALTQNIVNRLFADGDKRLTIVINRDGFLSRTDVQNALRHAAVTVRHGKAIDLRVLVELHIDDDTGKTLFICDDEFDIMPDILPRATVMTFQARNLFPRYDWGTIRGRDYGSLRWLFEQKQIVYLTREQTSAMVHEYDNSQARVNDEAQRLLSQWSTVTAKVDFHKPQQWAPQVAAIMSRALELERWPMMRDAVEAFNRRFQDFVKESYAAVAGASLSTRCPRNVTQVLPFVARRQCDKAALVVIDGMNLWQAELLRSHLVVGLPQSMVCTEASFAWLPSTTELSRQAIFRGSRPIDTYNQNPRSEERLWNDFWLNRRLSPIQIYYQFDGDITGISPAWRRVAYVTGDLDEKMHSATDFMYLYDDTKRWVNDGRILNIAGQLLQAGFTVFITTDHGNIETQGEVTLSSDEKVGANWSSRHITLHPSADKSLFARDHNGKVTQADVHSRTFYPVDRRTFSRDSTVTHGGTHWLEVIIPFITISNR